MAASQSNLGKANLKNTEFSLTASIKKNKICCNTLSIISDSSLMGIFFLITIRLKGLKAAASFFFFSAAVEFHAAFFGLKCVCA